MKPGGVLEVCLGICCFGNTPTQKLVACQVIDEDLLFPGHKPKLNGSVPPAQRRRRESSVVSSLSPTLNSRFMRTPDTSSVDVKTSLFTSMRTLATSSVDVKTSSLYTSMLADSQDDMNDSEDLRPSLQDAIETVNHSRLARAWHEMLTSRWISASITSVLPFYLTAIFETFRALPALEILMCPCPSLKSSSSKHGSHQQMLDPEPFRHLVHPTVKHEPEAHATWLPASEAPQHYVASNMSMHLARMVAIVSGCKEAIWGAYKKLYGPDPKSPLKGRSDGEETNRTSIHSVREEFERHWLNWEW